MNTPLSRRTLIRTATWATPTAAISTLTPAFAASSANPQTNTIAIIGTGYGGAVTALRLAEAGYTVDMYEMGMDWENSGKSFAKMSQPDETSVWFQDRTDMPFGKLFGTDVVNKSVPRRAGVLGIEYFANMKAYVGKGVGGGSLVNGGMAVTPNRDFFKQVLPSVDDTEMWDTYYPRAREELHVTNPAKDVIMNSAWYEFTRLGVREGLKAGIDHAWVPNVYDFNYMRRENFEHEQRSAFNQEVIFGNNAGKNDLTKTYMAKVRSYSNVTVIPMTEVKSIKQESNGTFTLAFDEIDFEGLLVKSGTKNYRKVVSAAGSIGTTRLMVNAKATGTIPALAGNSAVGTGWGPNGNTMTTRFRLGMTTGIYQSSIPTMGLTNWDNSPGSVFAEIAPLPAGIELNTSLYLAITNNPNTGTFTHTADGHMALDWTNATSAPSVNAARAFMDKLNAANGGMVRSDMFENGKQYTDYFTYHPLGGMVINEATDNYGQVKGVPGLFVADGSLIKAKIGVNPFVTITALAERNIEHNIATGAFK